MPQADSQETIRFGAFEIDLRQGALRKNGLRIRLPEQSFTVLAALLEKPGAVVSREELRRRLWGDDTFTDFEHGLNAAVNRLRDALCDSASEPKFIETIPKRGYSFIGTVEGREDRTEPSTKAGRSYLWWAIGAALVLGFVVAAALKVYTRSDILPPVAVTPLTTYNGVESSPALSPDGKFVAFSWNGPSEDNQDIYVQLIGPGRPVRLTSDPSQESSPSWSPDGKQIAFVRLNPDLHYSIHVVSALGGAERRIGTLQLTPSIFPLRISWTPDGRYVVASDLTGQRQTALHLASLDGSRMRQLTFPPPGMQDTSGVISPDAKWLALLRSTDSQTWRVHVTAIDEGYRPVGEFRAIGPARYSRLAPIWSADSRFLHYIEEKDGVHSMWRTDIAGSSGVMLVSAGWPAGWTEASIASGDRRVVVSDSLPDLDLWKLDLTGSQKPVRVASSTTSDINPQYSPDGRRIAFSSRRSGTFQIWVADSDGEKARKLTSMASTLTGMPNWSPDGKQIAFDSRVEGSEGIWVVDAEGGAPRRLTQPPMTGFNPSWSRDGSTIYFCSRNSGRVELWKMPVAPGLPSQERAVQVTRTGGWRGLESPDGRFLYYAQAQQNGPVMRISLSGSGEAEVTVPSVNTLHNFALVEDGMYYGISDSVSFVESISFYDSSSGTSKPLINTGRRAGIGLTVAPDRRTIVCTLMEERGGNLWLVEPADSHER
ncbi:MAG: PD40 domain-containing protein [Bryobacteraceae bacterium]|nr:PD40 domain-containing protein [Bryobacteraceae bacterium]